MEKAISITYSECVLVALGTRHAMRIRHIINCGLPCCTIFLHIISQTARFLKNVDEYKMSVFNFSQLLSETFLLLRTAEIAIIKMYTGLLVKYRLLLSDFNIT